MQGTSMLLLPSFGGSAHILLPYAVPMIPDFPGDGAGGNWSTAAHNAEGEIQHDCDIWMTMLCSDVNVPSSIPGVKRKSTARFCTDPRRHFLWAARADLSQFGCCHGRNLMCGPCKSREVVVGTVRWVKWKLLLQGCSDCMVNHSSTLI